MHEVSSVLTQGFATLSVDDRQKQAAMQNIIQWLEDDAFAVYRPQLRWLIEQGMWSLLLDSFYCVLPFGTGGGEDR